MNLSPLFVIIATGAAGLLGMLVGFIVGSATKTENQNDWDD